MASGLHPNFSLTFPGTLWNLAAIDKQPELVAEVRDETRRQVIFTGIDIEKGKVLWSREVTFERWWVSLTHATSDTLLVQQFDGTSNPDKRTWLGIDIKSFDILWANDRLQVDSIAEGLIIGRIDDQVQCVDMRSGKSVQGGKYEPVNEIPQVIRPFQYLEGTAHFETVGKFLGSRLNEPLHGGLEYREWEGIVFISYYISQDGSLANYLMVIREDGTPLHHEKLDTGLKGLGSDTFFLLQGCLFYIRNKHELISYRLT